MDRAKTAEERARLLDMIETHLADVRREKALYYDNRMRARREPKKYMSVVIDGADIRDHDLPHFAEASKLRSEFEGLKVHVYGALVHGHETVISTVGDHEKQGHNVTINMLWEVINRRFNAAGELPEVLFLQLDNTTKQNKGQYLSGFLGMLVDQGIFKKVVLSFLPVGHTHEDIDQLFSRIAIALRKNDALDHYELLKVMRQAFLFEENSVPEVIHWESIPNISDFLQPFMAQANRKPSTDGIVRFRHFRFIMHDGKPAVQARETMAGDFDKDGWRGLRERTNLTYLFPSGRGVPDLSDALKRGELPRAQKREMSATMDKRLTELKSKHFKALQETFNQFTDGHVENLESLIKAYYAPACQNPWTDARIMWWFKRGHVSAIEDSATSKTDRTRAFGFLEVGQFYIARPPDPPRDDTKPFWVGKLLSIDTVNDRVGVQWLDQAEDLNPVTDAWGVDTWVRAGSNDVVFAATTCLYDRVRLTIHRQQKSGHIYKDDAYLAKYWAETWDSTFMACDPHADEMPLD